MTSSSPRPDARHTAYLERVVGLVDSWQQLAPESEQAAVWLGTNSQGPVGVVKLYRPPREALREIRAYREWSPKLAPWTAPFHGVPDDDPGALVIGYVSGVSGTFSAPPKTFEAAGQFLATLHGLTVSDSDSVSLDVAVVRRFDALLRRSGALPGSGVHRAVKTVLDQGGFGVRVPCHRDFRPANWHLDSVDLTILDFGQSRPDCWLTDLVKLVFQWSRAQADAFFSGYGRPLTSQEECALVGLVGLHGLASIQWADRHHLERPRSEGMKALEWFAGACRRLGLG